MTPSLEPDQELSLPAARLHRSWRLPVLGLFLAGLGAWTIVADRPEAPIGFAAMLFGTVLAGASALRNAWPRVVPVTLRVTSRSLTIGDAPAVPVDAIAETKVVRGEKGFPEVLLGLRGGGERRLRLDPASAEMLLATLRIGPGERRATFPVMVAFRYRMAGMTTLVMLWFLSMRRGHEHAEIEPVLLLLGLGLYTLPLGALLAWIAGQIWRGEVVVGADGFSLRWLLMRPRFWSFGEVESVDGARRWHDHRALVTRVTLRSGRVLRLFARDTPTSNAQRGAESQALHRCLADAFERSLAPGAGGPSLESLLGRGQQGGAEWLASIDSVGREGGARYRVAAATTERLVETLQDAALSTSARAGAAAALLRCGDEAARRAVRVAADGCARPDLRRVLLALEQADRDEAFVEALDLLAPDAPARRA